MNFFYFFFFSGKTLKYPETGTTLPCIRQLPFKKNHQAATRTPPQLQPKFANLAALQASALTATVRSAELTFPPGSLSQRYAAIETTRTKSKTANTTKTTKAVDRLSVNESESRIGGGGGGGGAATKMEGTVSTAMPSAEEAAVMLERLDESEIVTPDMARTGTAMVAVMSTLAAVTRIVTRDTSTPARLAIEVWREDVTLSG